MKEIIDSADDSSVSCCHAALESGQIDHEDCIEMRQSATVEVEARTPLHALNGDDGPIIIDLNGPIRRSGRPPGRRRRLSMTEKTEGSSSSSDEVQKTLPLHQQSIRPCTPSSSTRHPHTPRIDSLPRLQPITPSSTISRASSSSASINSQLIGGGDGDLLTPQNFHRSSSLNSASSYSNSRSDSHIIINVHREDSDDDDRGGGGRRKIQWEEEKGARIVEQPATAPPSYRKRIIQST